jgi:hypothetical protein
MPPTLHILTACSRPAGLPRIAAAIAAAPAGLAIQWHVGFDLARRHVGGQAVKNRLLDSIAGGWCWVCDDDNLPHPAFFPRLAGLLAEPRAACYLFGQSRGPQGTALAAPPAIGRTDIAQVVVHRDHIGDLRIPESYDGDGHWIAALWGQGKTMQINEILTLYNAQRWL